MAPSFSSSINKSSKRIAPKAPQRNRNVRQESQPAQTSRPSQSPARAPTPITPADSVPSGGQNASAESTPAAARQPSAVPPSPTLAGVIPSPVNGSQTSLAQAETNLTADKPTQAEVAREISVPARQDGDDDEDLPSIGQMMMMRNGAAVDAQTTVSNASAAPTPETALADAAQSQSASSAGSAANGSSESNGSPEGENTETDKGAKKVARKSRGRTNKRARTPEDAEQVEIQTQTMKMGELCKDLKTGKKSSRYDVVNKLDWSEAKRQTARKRQRRKGDDAEDNALNEELDRAAAKIAQAAAPGAGAVQVRLVNGEWVIDETSTQVDRRAHAASTQQLGEVVEENEFTRVITSASYSKRERTERWDDNETQKFFDALGMFGTDFEMIAKLFPGRTRRQVKSKFTKHEKEDPLRIKAALLNRSDVDMKEYGEHCGVDFEQSKTEVERRLNELNEQARQDEMREKAAKEAQRKERENLEIIDGGEPEASSSNSNGKRKVKKQDREKESEVVILGEIA